jgi:hypothetical protein
VLIIDYYNKSYIMENQGDNLKSTITGSILILAFELIGTFFLTLLYLCNEKVRKSITNLGMNFFKFFNRSLY